MRKKKLIYFDNAATTYPKPESVYRAVDNYTRKYCGNPSRGSHSLALSAAEAVYESREALAGLFTASPESVVFTMNTTYALNMAIKAMVHEGNHVLISDMEHNSVLRPVHEVCRRVGASYDIFRTAGTADEIIEDIDRKRGRNTRLLVVTHQSNIIARTMPVEEISEYCRNYGIFVVADCAQSAGIIPLDLSKCKVDAVCVPAHKGLYGLQGCGAVIFGEDSGEELKTTIEGGSGSESIPLEMPDHLPDRFEAGTLPSPSIVSLFHGISFINGRGIENIRKHEYKICEYIINRLSSLDGITIYNDKPGSVLLFNIDGISPAEAASAFDKYGICLRAGLHCSPLAHRTLGTFPTGAIRVSFGAFNTIHEAEYFCDVAHRLMTNKKTT